MLYASLDVFSFVLYGFSVLLGVFFASPSHLSSRCALFLFSILPIHSCFPDFSPLLLLLLVFLLLNNQTILFVKWKRRANRTKPLSCNYLVAFLFYIRSNIRFVCVMLLLLCAAPYKAWKRLWECIVLMSTAKDLIESVCFIMFVWFFSHSSVCVLLLCSFVSS